MSKTLKFLTIVLVIVSFFSCRTTKPLQETTDLKKITVPFAGEKYQTDKENFRAVQSGKSIDLAMAKKIALLNAKAEMAGNIQAIVNNVTEQYSGQRTIGDVEEFNKKVEENARNVTSQQLNDIKIIGEEIFQEKNKSYIYWIAIEMSKKHIVDNLLNTISSDAKLQQDFDKYQFMKVFDEEMSKLKK